MYAGVHAPKKLGPSGLQLVQLLLAQCFPEDVFHV